MAQAAQNLIEEEERAREAFLAAYLLGAQPSSYGPTSWNSIVPAAYDKPVFPTTKATFNAPAADSTATQGALITPVEQTAAAVIPFPADGPRGSVAANSADLFVEDKTAFWQSKGYDGKIFEQELGIWDSFFNNDLTDEVLSQDESFIKAAKIVYEAEEGHAWPSSSGSEELTTWTMNHMRWVKNNLVVGGQNMLQNAMAEQDVQDAFKYVGDAYDAKDWTGLGFAKAAGQSFADPTNLIGGGLIAKAGLKAVRITGATGVLKKAGTFAAKTFLPATGLGGAFGAVQSVGVEQGIDYAAGAQENRINWSRTGTDALMGAAFGGGFSVLGASAVGFAPKIGRAFRGTTRNAGTATPNAGQSGGSIFSRTINNEGGFIRLGGTRDRGAPDRIVIPDYKEGENWKTRGYVRSWKPHKIFRNWFHHRSSAETDPYPMLRKIINAVDDNMEKNELIDKINDLDVDMNTLARDLRADPSKKTNILARLDTLRSDFVENNATALGLFETNVKAMRKHIADNYLTEAQWQAQNPGQSPPSGMDFLLKGNNGKKAGLLHGVDEKTGATLFSHKDALDAWLKDLENMTNDLQDPNFGSRKTAATTPDNPTPEPGSLGERLQGLSTLNTDEIAGRIETGLNRVTLYASETQKRLNPHGVWAQDREGLIRSLVEGYYNPHWRGKTAPGGLNVEKSWQNIDEWHTKYLKDDGSVEWPAEVPEAFTVKLKSMFDLGYEQEALNAMRYLQLKRGNKDIKTFPPSLAGRLKNDARYKKDLRYTHWVDKIEVMTDDGNLQGFNTVFFGEGRNTQRWYANQSQMWREGTRFTTEGTWLNAYKRYIALPGAITIKDELAVNPILKTVYYFAGAHSSKKNSNSDAVMQVIPEWNASPKKGEPGKATFFKNPVVRAMYRIPTGGITSTPGLYAVGYTAGFYALDAGMEYGRSYLSDGEYEADYNIKGPAKWIANKAIDLSDHASDFASFGILPRLSAAGVPLLRYLDAPHDLARESINLRRISKRQAMAALSKYTLAANGQLVDFTGAPGTTSLNEDPIAGLAAQNLAENNEELTKANLQKYYTAARKGRAVTKTIDDDKTKTKDDDKTKTKTKTKTSGTTTTTTTTTTTPETTTRTGGATSAWGAAGDLVSGLYGGGADWLGDGRPGGMGSKFGAVASGFGGWASNLFSDMSSGRMKDGQKWLAGIIGVVAAIFGTNILKSSLGLDKVPFIGLILAPLFFLYGGKLAHAAIQGEGSLLPASVNNNSQSAVPPTDDILAKTDHAGNPDYDWYQIRVADNDNDGDYDAVQMTMDDGTHIDFKLVSASSVNSAVSPADIANAKTTGRYLDKTFLKGKNLGKASRWDSTFAAVAHDVPGGKEVYMRAASGNDDRVMVLEFDN